MHRQAFIVFAAALAQLGLANPLPGSEPSSDGGHPWYHVHTVAPAPTDTPDTHDVVALATSRRWYFWPISPNPALVTRDGSDMPPATTARAELAHKVSGRPWYAGWPAGDDHIEGGHSWYGWPIEDDHTEGGHSWYWGPPATATPTPEP